ncbi:DUF7344 domain-containing protein [Natronorubrum halophilum]|uniref:DUF7344 domain-containing protein n=1 Tax=Natronorubrum halophilum TaxID=1702106 RepID=UPI001EE7EE21|nr:hypothetical protein [Natronorubrum halophilum]
MSVESMNMTTLDLSLDSMYGILSEPRRRYVLYYFLDNDHANIEELSLQIVAWERHVSVDGVSEEQTQRLTSSLIHTHIPLLADHGLVDYDSRTGDIIIADGFADIRVTANRARSIEEGEVELTGSS